MKTITIEVPDDFISSYSEAPEQLTRDLQLAAAIFWYDRGLISQGMGAEIAGLTRVEFIDALGKAGVAAIQTSVDELRAEKAARERSLDARC